MAKYPNDVNIGWSQSLLVFMERINYQKLCAMHCTLTLMHEEKLCTLLEE